MIQLRLGLTCLVAGISLADNTRLFRPVWERQQRSLVNTFPFSQENGGPAGRQLRQSSEEGSGAGGQGLTKVLIRLNKMCKIFERPPEIVAGY